MLPRGVESSLALLPEIQASLTCVFGMADPLIPAKHREVFGDPLRKDDSAGRRLRLWSVPAASTTSFTKLSGASIPRSRPRDGASCLGTTLCFSLEG